MIPNVAAYLWNLYDQRRNMGRRDGIILSDRLAINFETMVLALNELPPDADDSGGVSVAEYRRHLRDLVVDTDGRARWDALRLLEADVARMTCQEYEQ